MIVALRGYSHIKCGEGRTTKQQESIMYSYFHGNPPTRPSQLKMLTHGEGQYSDLYDYSTKTVVDKHTSVSSRLYLKSSLTMDDTFNYLSKIDINSEDLEKRTLTSKLLITGRSLLNMAKKGLKMYKKALGYAAKKWNIEKCEPIESGTTADDVIEYVRQQMYSELHYSESAEDSSVEGSDDESDVDNTATSDKATNETENSVAHDNCNKEQDSCANADEECNEAPDDDASKSVTEKNCQCSFKLLFPILHGFCCIWSFR